MGDFSLRFNNPHLIRQVALLRLSDRDLVAIATKQGIKIPSLGSFPSPGSQDGKTPPNTIEIEAKLLSMLEQYEEVLDLAHEFLNNPDLIYQLAPEDLTDLVFKALEISGEIQKSESDKYYEQLFKGVDSKSNSLSQDIEIITQNAQELYALTD